VVAAAIAAAAVTPISTMATVLARRATLKLFVLLLDVGNQVLAQLLGFVNHAIIRSTVRMLVEAGIRIGY
jgi:hypothetical protein